MTSLKQYWGSDREIVGSRFTGSGVIIGQRLMADSNGDKSFAAVCGECYHLLHWKSKCHWVCSEDCGFTVSLPNEPEASVFSGEDFDRPGNKSRFREWVSQWTMIKQIDLKIEYRK